MGIVLAETTYTGETRKCTRKFVSMKYAEIRESERKLAVRSKLIVEHEAVTWAVHWLHSESLVLNLQQEEIFLVLIVVAGGLPKFEVENVGGGNFLESSDSVLLSDECH